VQEYYAAQCANTKLNYERKQLQRTRDQLLGQWRTHDSTTCRHPTAPPQVASGSTTPSTTTEPSVFDFLSSSTLAASFPVTSGSTAVDELGGGSPLDISDDDTDDGDVDSEEEYADLFDEAVMADLDIYDPLSRSLSGPPASSADTSMSFDDVDVPSFVLDEPPAPYALRTARSAAEAVAVDPARLLPQPVPRCRSPTSSLTRDASAAKSPLLPVAGVAPSPCAADAETPTRCETSGEDARITTSRKTSTGTTHSPAVANIPLHLRTLSADDVD